MKVQRLLFTLLTGVSLTIGTVHAATAAGVPVTISVDLNHPGAGIAADFTGLSFETSLLLPNENGTRYFRPDNRPLIQLFHTLGIKSLRIGGNTGDRDVKKIPGEADIDSLFAFARAADVKVIYCLRLHNGDPQIAAQTAKYIMDRYASLVEAFSIGQEPSAYPVEKKDTRAQAERMGAANEKYQYSDYAAGWKKFADAIIAAVPDVKLCGPGVHNNGVWAQKFMADFARSNHVTLITEHLYPGGAGGKVPTPETGINRMLAGENSEMTNSFPKAYQKLHDSFVPMAAANALPYRLEEVNNYFNGGATNVSNTFASALWGLDFMYWWATHGAAGLNFHTGDKVAAGSTLQPSKYTAFFSTTNGFLVRPLGYGIKAFELGSHGKMVPIAMANPEHLNLSAYAVLGDDKNLYLTVINKEHGENARAARIVPDKVNIHGAQVLSLTAPDGDIAATSGETLGGGEIKTDGSWNGKWTTANEPGILTVPAASAVIIKLTGN
ncbi:MAG TPA: hypothetical protein VNN22_18195 [Verrucomicrobiae bacterium]|nr:hypothetical protein [Verrucomicrobiae bacterium]